MSNVEKKTCRLCGGELQNKACCGSQMKTVKYRCSKCGREFFFKAGVKHGKDPRTRYRVVRGSSGGR